MALIKVTLTQWTIFCSPDPDQSVRRCSSFRSHCSWLEPYWLDCRLLSRYCRISNRPQQ